MPAASFRNGIIEPATNDTIVLFVGDLLQLAGERTLMDRSSRPAVANDVILTLGWICYVYALGTTGLHEIRVNTATNSVGGATPTWSQVRIARLLADTPITFSVPITGAYVRIDLGTFGTSGPVEYSVGVRAL